MRSEGEFYNIQKDQNFMTNLAYLPGFDVIKNQPLSYMEAELIHLGDPRTLDNAGIFDKFHYVGPGMNCKIGKRIKAKVEYYHLKGIVIPQLLLLVVFLNTINLFVKISISSFFSFAIYSIVSFL